MQRGIAVTAEENVTCKKKITSLLSKLDLDIRTFPSDIKEALEKWALILRNERLPAFDEAALRVAREQQFMRRMRQQREEKQMSLMYNKLLKNCATLQGKLNVLQSAIEALECTVDGTEKDKDNMYCSNVFLSAKVKEYQQAIEKLESDLSDMQVDELYPETILNKYKTYLQETNKLADLQQSLAQYDELPPNLLEAKMLVENKRKEYKNVEQLFLEETQ